MSAPTARRLVTAGSLSLTLALAAPAAAFADHGNSHGENGKGGKGGSKPQATATASPAPEGKGSSAQGSSSSAGKGGSGSQGSNSNRAGKQGKKAPAKRAATGDPRGNNGTVKIDGEPFDSTPGNEPHVGCTFQVDFFGFDAGDTALVTLTGHAPTGGGELYRKSHTISTDAAGGGQDVDESITFTAAQLGLFSIPPHPKQGWHIKLAADVDGAPGGAKQKVFWVKCAQPAALGGSTTDAATGGSTTDAATGGSTTDAATGGGSTVAATGGGATTTTTTTSTATKVLGVRALEQSAPELTLGAGSTTLNGSTQAAAGAGSVAARSAARPSALPFTGAQGLAYLLALGASAVGVGALAHRAGRRRAVPTEV